MLGNTLLFSAALSGKKFDVETGVIKYKGTIYWGRTYGKGDDVRMNLHEYMKMLTRPIAEITRVERLKDTKGFRCSSPGACRGYEVFWINEKSETKEYDWLGLVIITEKIKGKWYVVALLRDRWVI